MHELRLSELGVWGQGGFVPEERLIPSTKNCEIKSVRWLFLWNVILNVFSASCVSLQIIVCASLSRKKEKQYTTSIASILKEIKKGLIR